VCTAEWVKFMRGPLTALSASHQGKSARCFLLLQSGSRYVAHHGSFMLLVF